MEKFHLIGIKGTGMSALASILKDLGHDVTGSDVEEDFFTSKKLKEKGIEALAFNKNNIVKDRVYIASTCYDQENEEVDMVYKKKLPFYYYHDFIGKFFKNKRIGISGTHGKTTTTSLIAKIFEDKDIAYLIGDGNGGAKPNYDYFIFEACEYQNHFLNYNFDYLVINNIELDHPDFFRNTDEVISSFQKAANKAHHLIINADDNNCLKIDHQNVFSFGINNGVFRGKVLNANREGFQIAITGMNQDFIFHLPFTGIHMVYNFLAALFVAYLNGISFEEVQEKLYIYQRPSRRAEEYLYQNNIIIDDYAHHPKEIQMCLNGIKQKYPDKDIIVIFQPHTYSRTLALQEDFQKVFQGVELYLAETFTSKRENGNQKLEQKVVALFPGAHTFHPLYIEKFKKLENKVIIFLGAGNINKYIKEFL
jgi:UDP-N-acetylmuramate--alanine ligase